MLFFCYFYAVLDAVLILSFLYLHSANMINVDGC